MTFDKIEVYFSLQLFRYTLEISALSSSVFHVVTQKTARRAKRPQPLKSGNQDKSCRKSRTPKAVLTDLGVTFSSDEEQVCIPRKEVIQPHLPVRLPCYDFTPITDPTLDACLSCELAQRLQVLPTFVV